MLVYHLSNIRVLIEEAMIYSNYNDIPTFAIQYCNAVRDYNLDGIILDQAAKVET